MQTVMGEMKRVCPEVGETIRLVRIAIALCGDPHAMLHVTECSNRPHCLHRHARLDELPGCLLMRSAR